MTTVQLPHIYGKMGQMKTTVEIPDDLFRKAKATAAESGVSLKVFLTDAVREHLKKRSVEVSKDKAAPPWMAAFGGLRHLRKETKRINQIIEQAFEQLDED